MMFKQRFICLCSLSNNSKLRKKRIQKINIFEQIVFFFNIPIKMKLLQIKFDLKLYLIGNMRCMMKRIYLIFVLSVVVVSCSNPQYALRPTPETRSKTMSNYSEAEMYDLGITGRYSYAQKSDVFFYVEITNNTDGDFHLRTDDLFYIPCNRIESTEDFICYENPRYAYSPEKEKQWRREAIAESESQEKVEKAITGISFLFDVLTIVLTDYEDESDKVVDTFGSAAGHGVEYVAIDETHDEYRDMLKNEIQFWTVSAINDTIIPPGGKIRGLIGFPYNPGEYDRYRVVLPTTEGEMEMVFESYVIEE